MYMYKNSTYANFLKVVIVTKIKPSENLTGKIFLAPKISPSTVTHTNIAFGK